MERVRTAGIVINVGFMQTSDGIVDPKRDLRAKHVSGISSRARGCGSAEAYVKTPFVLHGSSCSTRQITCFFATKSAKKNQLKLAL